MNPPLFESFSGICTTKVTLRDLFALGAMGTAISLPKIAEDAKIFNDEERFKQYLKLEIGRSAQWCYVIADAMLEAREPAHASP